MYAPRKLKRMRKSQEDISMGSYIIFTGMSFGLLLGVSVSFLIKQIVMHL